MKLHEIARQAIETSDSQLAESLVAYCQRKHGLNYIGVTEYLAAHGIDRRDFEEALKS